MEDYRLFHVGGREEGIGPAIQLLKIGKRLLLTIFEAELGEGKEWAWQNKFDKYNDIGVRLEDKHYCLFSSVGKRPFYINEQEGSSGLFKVDPRARSFLRKDANDILLWGKACHPKKTIEVETTTLNKLYEDGEIKPPHFLSIDAQASEYDIIKGTDKVLDNLTGVVTEVEFWPLYENQPLFTDQFELLRKHRFNLYELYNREYWNEGVLSGSGALMVAEALFLRDMDFFTERDDVEGLINLAVTAFCFGRLGYTMRIIDYILARGDYNEYLNDNFLSGLIKYYYGIREILSW